MRIGPTERKQIARMALSALSAAACAVVIAFAFTVVGFWRDATAVTQTVDRIVMIEAFANDAVQNIDHLVARINSTREECLPPFQLNWPNEVRTVEGSLQDLLRRARGVMGVAPTDDVEQEYKRLQETIDEITQRIGSLATSVSYYEQFAGEICRAHDSAKAAEARAETRRTAIQASAAGLLRQGLAGLERESVTGFNRNMMDLFAQLDESSEEHAVQVRRQPPSIWRQYFHFRLGGIFGGWALNEAATTTTVTRYETFARCMSFVHRDDVASCLDRTLELPGEDRDYVAGTFDFVSAMLVGRGADRVISYGDPDVVMAVVDRYLTVDRGEVDERPAARRNASLRPRRNEVPSRFTVEDQWAGLEHNGGRVVIRRVRPGQRFAAGNLRPLDRYLAGVREYLQAAVSEECVVDFRGRAAGAEPENARPGRSAESQEDWAGSGAPPEVDLPDDLLQPWQRREFRPSIVLSARFAGTLDRLDPPLSRDERGLADNVFHRVAEAMSEASLGEIRRVCSEDAPTRGDEYLTGLFGQEFDSAAAVAAEADLRRFDRAYFVGDRVMQDIQANGIMAPENVNGPYLQEFGRVFEALAESATTFGAGDIKVVSEMAERFDLGPIGRSMQRYQAQYDAEVQRLRGIEAEIALIEIKNAQEMDLKLLEHATTLQSEREQTIRALGQGRLTAWHTVRGARIRADADVRMEEIRAVSAITQEEIRAESAIRQAEIKTGKSRGDFVSLLFGDMASGFIRTVGGPVGTSLGSELTSALGIGSSTTDDDDGGETEGETSNSGAGGGGSMGAAGQEAVALPF